ncbi:Por secretion system C-terminal sorting domain-containing protein [Flexibacter flexilis DSM 6793]|uniref:Por secretion system C-terminal sorting domain-containing protein n=1 Tax=Flexibacter flexilis DSM 6793 TaxID=927664 RepID=A0A1I1MSG7_9BACT|nr:T9SS type A sorting domain-containing protein [Flexibacter flexilis]SFC84500.1 Por secretion system C-terminal sorting domain-containing protein [Flexibacter flexilis DSM 6793]
MKKAILPVLLFAAHVSFGQSVIGSINTGAVSSNNMVFSVGEVFVIPTNPNEANSGIIGALSRIEFAVVGTKEQLSSASMNVFPNPTTGSIVFQSPENIPFKEVFIFDNAGRLVMQKTNQGTPIDLSGLANGLYTVSTDNKKISSFKIVKQ